MLARTTDPIVAIATASGRGAVGIVRVSGARLAPLIAAVCGRSLKPREATYLPFRDAGGGAIDHGLAIHFPAPHSSLPAKGPRERPFSLPPSQRFQVKE